ncbi:hypothetical protein M422DRAFT_264980 [Sphaerobolus stellatus SS14]|uniref:Uncharacterized protein n=1 Tax=Sphaerobolus stellatus (strain SS14) TaxID=990650 RepID=A0A0C9V6K2_SPHS4|nr:hypothetical protein M422DRAFT_264980 [Sphaerobolus stellatus SS14]
MSNHHGHRQEEEPFMPAVGEDESHQGLTMRDLTDPHQLSVDPQQTMKVFAQEHPGDQNTGVHSPRLYLYEYSHLLAWQEIISRSDSGHNLRGVPDESDCISPDEGGMENKDGSFTIRASEVSRLHEEYAELMNLKEMIRTSMNRMFPTMKELLIVPKPKSSGKTIETGNNQTHVKAATKAATK